MLRRRPEVLQSGACFEPGWEAPLGVGDESWARQWLRDYQGDPLRMGELRRRLASEHATPPIHHASDDEVIEQAVRLILAGVWRIAEEAPAAAEPAEERKGWQRAPSTAPSASSSQVLMRKSWRVKTQFGSCRVVRAADLGAGEEFLAHAAETPLPVAVLARTIEGPNAVTEVHQTLSGKPGSSIAPDPFQMTRAIEQAFRTGELVLIAEQEQSTGGGSGGDAAQAAGGGSGGKGGAEGAAGAKAAKSSGSSAGKSAATAKAVEKTWFRMQLMDEDGDPMAGEDYVVVDSAGATRKGKLDDNGQLYIPPILPPGDCTVSFPNIHLNPRKRKK